MASGFNLTAQLNLRGPSNIKDIVSDIRKQIGSIKADVNLKIDPASIQNVTKLNAGLGNLNKTLSNTTTSATNAAAAIKRLSVAMGQVGAGTVSRDMDAVARAAGKVSKAMQVTSRQTSQAASEMVEFGRVSGLAIRRFAAFSTVTGAVYALTNAINQGVSAYIEYDRQLVKLQQITGESAAGLKGLEDAITSLSVGLGVSSADLTEVASTLAQAGLNAKDTERALKALALSALAPSFDSMNDTVEGSIALMRQFGISASELEQSLGSVNSVAARFAVEAGDLIAAIQRTGGVFATASRGVSEGTDALNEFLAVFTSVRATTRESAETIATGLRTIFTRIQRGDTIEALKAYGVNLTDLDGKFVGAYKAVERLSQGLSTLDPRDLRFSEIVEELGGFRQIGKVIPLIQQFATAQDALKVAQQGQGSLAEDAAKAQLSLAIQTAKVKQEFLALFREIGKSDSFQTIAKGALSLASGLIKVADSVKGVLPVLGVMLAFRGASAITQFAGGFSRGVRGIGGARGLGERMGGGGRDTRASQGGRIYGFASGGVVPGSGRGDKVPALLEPGEVVMSNRAVRKYGRGNLVRMNNYAAGGVSKKPFKKVTGKPLPETDELTNLDFRGERPEFTHLGNSAEVDFQAGGKKVRLLYTNMGLDLPRAWNRNWGTEKKDNYGASGEYIVKYIKESGKDIFKTLKTGKKIYRFTGRGESLAQKNLNTYHQKIKQNFIKNIQSKDFLDTDNEVGQTLPNILIRSIKSSIKDKNARKSIIDGLQEVSAFKEQGSNARKAVTEEMRSSKSWDKAIAATATTKSKNQKSLGGLVQRFMAGGATEEEKIPDRIALIAAKNQASILDTVLSEFKAIQGSRLKEKLKIPNAVKLPRVPDLEKGVGVERVKELVNRYLHITGSASAAAEAKNAKKHKVAIAGLFPLDYSTDFPDWKLADGKEIYGIVRGFGSQFLEDIQLMQQRTMAARDEFAANIQNREALGLLGTSSVAGPIRPLAIDFDETLALGTKLTKVNAEGKTVEDIPAYRDRTKVGASLASAKPTALANRLAEIEKQNPGVIRKYSRILTARPQETADLIASALNRFGLPYTKDDITGLGGEASVDIPRAKAFNLAAFEKLIDDSEDNIRAVRAAKKDAFHYGEIQPLNMAAAEAVGQSMVDASILEGALGQSLGYPIDLDKLERNRAVDFPQGLGRAAQYFGIPPNIETEVKRTLDKDAFSKARDEFSRYFTENPDRFNNGGLVQYFANAGEVRDRSTKNRRRGSYGPRGFVPLNSREYEAFADKAYIEAGPYGGPGWGKVSGVPMPKVLADYAEKINRYVFETGGAGLSLGKKLVKIPDDIDPEALEALKEDLIRQYDGWYSEIEEVLPFGKPTATPSGTTALAKDARVRAAMMAEAGNKAYTQAEDAIASFKKTGSLAPFDPAIDSYIKTSFPKYISELESSLKSETDSDEKTSIQRRLKKAQSAWPDYQALLSGTPVANQGRVTALSETLNSLLERYGSPVSSGEVDNIIKAMGSKLLRKNLGGLISRFAKGGKADYYGLEKSSGLSSREFDSMVQYAKTNDFSLDEFKAYLSKRAAQKQSMVGSVIDRKSLQSFLMHGATGPRLGTGDLTDEQKKLAEILKGPPDPQYDPNRFANGGTVPALVSNGEAYVPPKVAKSIGYAKLNRMNQADRNGMGRFSDGGISVFKGPGTGTSDSIRTNLPVGSFILREKATKALGLSGGGAVQRFESGGSPIPVRPENINAATIRIDQTAINSMNELEQIIRKLGITGSSTSKLLTNTSNVSYREAAKAAKADLDRAKAAGASTSDIIAAENALIAIRNRSKDEINKRKILENTFSSASGMSSGEAQQQILSRANSGAAKRIEAIERSRTNKNTKELVTEKKTNDYNQIVDDLSRKAMGSTYGPLSPSDIAKIEQEASKRVMQRSASGKYDLTEAEQRDIKSSSAVSDEERQNIYRSQTLKATSRTTGVSQSALTRSGVNADDIRQYAQESMMDRKTLAQMDAQYRVLRTAELQTAGKTASEAKRLVEQELKDRRAAANAVARQKGIRGPGSTGITGAIGNVGRGFTDTLAGWNKKFADTRLGSGVKSLAGGNAGYYMGTAIAALGGQSDGIAKMFGGDQKTQAGVSAGIQSATSTVGAGLSLATSVAGIPGIGPLASAATLAGTAVMALAGAAKSAAEAQKEYENSLKTKAFEEAADVLSRSMDKLSKDVGDVNLQNIVRRDIASFVEASSKTTSVATDARRQELNEERISKMGTFEYAGSYFTENTYAMSVGNLFGMGYKMPQDNIGLSKIDYDKVAAKEAPKNEAANQAALQILEQEFKKSDNPENLLNEIIYSADDVFKSLREAMARARPETLAQIIQIEEKMAKTKDAATLAELQSKKDNIITESARNNKMLESMKKTEELNKAMEAADKAGRQLARTFESMARSVSQAIGRSKFETESMEDSLPNDGKLRSRRSLDANILENPNAYSDAERANANKNIANRIYDPNAAGLAPEERKRRQDQADKVEKALSFDSFSFANRLTGAGNTRRQNDEDADLDSVAGAVKAQMTKEIAGLPEEMRAEIEKRFESIKSDVDKDSKLSEQQKGDEFLRRVQDDLGKSASDAADKMRKMALDVENFATDSLNRFVDATNRAVDAQLKAEDAYRRARDIRTESDVSLRETLSGGSIGLGERANIIDARIASMTGGLTDPTQIKGQIDQLNKDMSNRATKRDADLAGTTNQKDRLDIETKAASDMAQMSKQIQSSQKALEELANSTDLATAAMNQLQAIQGLQKERLQTLDQVLTSSPQELKKFNESLIRVQQRAMGINPNPSKEARRAYNQALRQSGGNRRVASMAAQEQMAQDRAMDLRTMEQMKSSFIMNQVNAGMSMEDANKMYNMGAANVRGQMAFESGAVGMYGTGVLGAIAAGANPLVDPSAKNAADIYNQANQRQATANEALAQQAVEDSKQILKVASNQLAEVLIELSKRIAGIDIQADKDLQAKAGVVVVPAGGKANGGVVYARLGKLIDFKPQGSDTVPAMLTPGEFVVNAKATAQHLPLLKAINSGSDAIVSKTMSKGGVVYLAEGGQARRREDIEAEMSSDTTELQSMDQQLDNQRQTYASSDAAVADQQEVQRLAAEREDSQRAGWWYEARGDSNQAAANWARNKVGDSNWENMTEDQRNAERDKYLPEFNQIQSDYDQKRKDKGYESGSIASANFFNQQKEENATRFEAARAAEENKKTEIAARTSETPEQQARRSELESRQAQNRTNVRDLDFLEGRERKGPMGIGNEDYGVKQRAAELAGISKQEYYGLMMYPGVMSGAKPPPEVQAKLDKIKSNEAAATEQLKQEASARLSQQGIAPAQPKQPSVAAAQQAQQANDAKQKAETQKQEQRATAVSTTQQQQVDPLKQAQQATANQAQTVQGMVAGRTMAIQTGQFNPGEGSPQVRQYAASMGMTVQELQYAQQQQKLARMKPEQRDREIARLQERGKLIAPSALQAEQQKFAAMQQATAQAMQQQSFENKLSSMGEAGRAEYEAAGGKMPDQTSIAMAQRVVDMGGQSAASMSEARTESSARSSESTEKQGPLLESTVPKDKKDRYEELEAKRRKGRFNLKDPLTADERKEWTSLYRQRELGAVPTANDNARRLALMGIAPRDRTPEQQEEYLRLRYQSDAYRSSKGQKRTISGATADENFGVFKERVVEEQYARDDKRYDALSQKDPGSLAEYDRQFVKDYVKQQSDRKNKVLSDMSAQDAAFGSGLQDVEQGLAANEATLADAKSRSEEYKKSKEFQEDQAAIANIENQRQQAQYKQFVSEQIKAGINNPELLAEAWASQRGLDQIKDPADRQKMLLSYEKEASDLIRSGSAAGGLSDAEFSELGERFKEGKELSPQDKRELINQKFAEEQQKKQDEINQRVFGSLAKLDDRASGSNIDRVREQARAYAQAADRLSRIKNVDNKAQIEAFRAKAEELDGLASRFKVSGYGTEDTQAGVSQVQQGLRVSGSQLEQMAADSKLTSVRTDKGIDQYATDKRVAAEQEQARVAAEKAAEEAKVRAAEQEVERQRQEAAEAEQKRKDSMWVNSSNPLIAGLGYVAGAAEAGGRTVRGGLYAGIGNLASAASGLVGNNTEEAERSRKLDAQIKERRAKMAKDGRLVGQGEDQNAALARLNAELDAQTKAMETASRDAFKGVVDEGAAAGLSDVKSVGTLLFDPTNYQESAVGQFNTKQAQTLRDSGQTGLANILDVNNYLTAGVTEVLPGLLTGGASGVSGVTALGRPLTAARSMITAPFRGAARATSNYLKIGETVGNIKGIAGEIGGALGRTRIGRSVADRYNKVTGGVREVVGNAYRGTSEVLGEIGDSIIPGRAKAKLAALRKTKAARAKDRDTLSWLDDYNKQSATDNVAFNNYTAAQARRNDPSRIARREKMREQGLIRQKQIQRGRARKAEFEAMSPEERLTARTRRRGRERGVDIDRPAREQAKIRAAEQKAARYDQTRIQGEQTRYGYRLPNKQGKVEYDKAAIARDRLARRAAKRGINAATANEYAIDFTSTVTNTGNVIRGRTGMGRLDDIIEQRNNAARDKDVLDWLRGKQQTSATSTIDDTPRTSKVLSMVDEQPKSAAQIREDIANQTMKEAIESGRVKVPQPTEAPPPANPAAKAQAQAEAVAARHRQMEGTEYSWPSKPAPEGTPGMVTPPKPAPATPAGLSNDILARISRGEGYMDGGKFVAGKRPSGAIPNTVSPVPTKATIKAGSGASQDVVNQVGMRQQALAERLGAYASSDEAAKALKQSGAFNIKSVEVADALTARNTGGDSAVRAAGAAYSPSTRSVKMTKGRLGSQSANAVIDHELAHAMQHNTIGGLGSKAPGGPLVYEQKLMDSLGADINDFLSSPKGYQALRDAAMKDTGVGSLYTADRIKMEPVELFTSLVQASAGKDFNRNQQAVDMLKKLMKFHGYAKGGIVYANNGALIEARPLGTDTVPAMLTPGEFVVKRDQAQKHMPVLQAINKGYYNQGGIVQHLANGGIVAPQYYSAGGVAGMLGAAAGTSRGKDSTMMGLDMAAVQELAKSLDSLKDTFGSLENVRELGNNLQQAVSNMGQNITAFGEHVSGMPAELLHNISATVTQHVLGIDNAEQRYANQFNSKMDQVAQNHTAQAVHNLHKTTEGAVTNGNIDGIIGRAGGLS